ncbi:MAG: DUF3604 domain-containing protein [Chitinophagales bacterium]|nr:DUF3604 domain-containing protein [Chitinophagales bacterium]
MRFIILFLSILIPHLVNAQNSVDDYFTFYITPDTAEAGSAGTWQAIIKAKQEIPVNSMFKLKFVKGTKVLQKASPQLPGFVKGSTNAQGATISINSIARSYDENLPFWEMNVQDLVITFFVRNAGVLEGDSIIIGIGDGNGEKAYAPIHTTATVENLEIAMSTSGVKNLNLSNQQPVFKIRPKSTQRILLFASSVLKEGEEGKLLITNEDEFKNLNDRFVGDIQLNSNSPDEITLPNIIHISASDSGKIEIPFTIFKEGSYVITGTYLDGNIPVKSSNPIRVDNHRPHIYWGDLHSHGAPSRDGIGRGRYAYARYARGLDFFCATDHADHGMTIFGISDREWERQKKEVLESHEPGKFIPFIGYENSFLFPTGHYNIIFNVKDEDLDSVPMWPMRRVNDIQTIWSLAQNVGMDVLTIPHHCGKVFNYNDEKNECKNCNSFGGIQYNEKYKRLVEIYSFHGLSESYNPNHNLDYSKRSNIARSYDGPNYVQDAWAMGEKLGVIASSDDHFGQPGLIVNGVAAVLTDELSRDALFKGLYNRHSYGTTGEHIWVDFRVNEQLMGSTIKIASHSKPVINFDIMGTDSIDYVEVLKWDFKRGVYEKGHPKYEVIAKYTTDLSHPTIMKKEFIDEGVADSCLYYLRVKQTDSILDFLEYKQVWAWTSPVWVSYATDIDRTDSLKSYAPEVDGKQIIHSWTMYDNFGVTKYEIEKINEIGVWQTIFTLTPIDTAILEFDYVETKPKNGWNTYRIKYTTSKGEEKYSQPVTLHIELDVIDDFSYSFENGSILLDWRISKESHTEYSTIELQDGDDFKLLSKIEADYDPFELLSLYNYNTGISETGTYTFRLNLYSNQQVIDSKLLTVEIIPTNINQQEEEAENFVLKTNIISPDNPFIEYKINRKLLGSKAYIIDLSGRLVKDLGTIDEADIWNRIFLGDLSLGSFRIVVQGKNKLKSLPFMIVH